MSYTGAEEGRIERLPLARPPVFKTGAPATGASSSESTDDTVHHCCNGAAWTRSESNRPRCALTSHRAGVQRNCDNCGQGYEVRPSYIARGQGRFCSRSCAGFSAAEKQRDIRQNPPPNQACGVCGKPLYRAPSRPSKSGLYFCSNAHASSAARNDDIPFKTGPAPADRCCTKCGKRKRRKADLCVACDRDARLQRWLAGDSNSGSSANGELRSVMRSFLFESRGDQCEICHFSGRNIRDGRSIIQVDHRDGNPRNNAPGNLQLLCPNCHAMTETFGSRNRGNGRKHRRKMMLSVSDSSNASMGRQKLGL